MNTSSISRFLLGLLLAAVTAAAAGPGPGPGPGIPGPGPGGPGGAGIELANQLRDLRLQLDQILQTASAEYAELLAKEEKTFEDLQALATLREQLIQESVDAQAVLAEMTAVREAFRESRPHGPRRPDFAPGDLNAVQEHKQTMTQLAAELEAILKDASPDYAALADKPDKTPEEVQQLQQLRQQLLADIEAAQAKLGEMQDVVARFREQFPQMPMGGPPAAQGMRRRAEAVRALRETIDDILAQESARYGELLTKQTRTQEETREMVRLRQQLIANNEEAQNLQNATRIMNGRMRGTLRRLRNQDAQVDDPAAGE